MHKRTDVVAGRTVVSGGAEWLPDAMEVIGVSKTSDACGSKKYASRTFVSVCASGLPEEGIWYDAAPRPARLAVHRKTVHMVTPLLSMCSICFRMISQRRRRRQSI
jgi:hypothetical protein